MKKRRRVRPFVWLGAFVVASMGTSDVTAKKPGADRRIAVLLDGPVEGIDKVVALAREELASFGHSSPSLLSKRLTKVGDFTLKTARQQLDRALADPKVDIVWAFGVIASAAAVQRATSGRLKKPVVAPFVLAPGAEALKKLDGRTSNLSYVVLTPALSRDLKALRTLQPIDHLAYLLSPSIRQALPDIETALKANAQALGVKLHIASDSDPQRLVDGLPADIDAVYVGLDPHQTEDDLKTLVSALIARRLPSFAQGGRAGVELGLLMGLSGPENAMRLARAVAVNTDAILQGEAPGALNYAFGASKTSSSMRPRRRPSVARSRGPCSAKLSSWATTAPKRLGRSASRRWSPKCETKISNCARTAKTSSRAKSPFGSPSVRFSRRWMRHFPGAGTTPTARRV